MKFVLTLGLPLAALLSGCVAGDTTAQSGSKSAAVAAPTLNLVGELQADAPVLRVRGHALRYALHVVNLPAHRLTRVRVTAVDPQQFDPLIECRAQDGAPDEVVRCEDFSALGNGVQLDLLPERAGPWLIYVGDEQGRTGQYKLEVAPVAERSIYRAQGRTVEALTGTEKPATLFCQLQAGRRYRATITAKDFPPHFLIGVAGGPTVRVPESGELSFLAPQSGQAVLQVSSLSLASGPFTIEVVELWD